MISIPLRSYVREIEKHVENGRNDEAIAHCRHILETYPKYTDVYRLLGKAFLESQRYGDAADIFQRVLSSSPDDFVSNVGMSIVREDEGNLDEAIWHMERAFEIQPANTAIQDELRRLYGRRDGVEPPKVRLTRGALARMYFKGELYQQAITEIRTAIAENPKRLDLQILLSEVYSKTGQLAEASEIASNVIRKLPYCLIANQIMIKILVGTAREKEGQVFQDRLNQIEPYSAFITPENPTATSVPDHMIKIEKLDWKPGQAIGGLEGQPIWAKSLGIEVDDKTEEKEEILPKWLTGEIEEEIEEDTDTDDQQAVPAFSFDVLGEIPPPGELTKVPDNFPSPTTEEEVPEWMKEVDWNETVEELKEEESPHDEAMEIPEQDEVEIASAEIPDWLRAMAPSPGPNQFPELEDIDTSWMDEIISASKDKESPDHIGIKDGIIDFQEQDKLPDWLAIDESESEYGTSDKTSDQLPDWMKEESELSDKFEIYPATEQEGSKELEEAPSAGDELPEWIFEEHDQGKAPTSEVKISPSAQEMPDWLVEIAEQKAAAQPAEEVSFLEEKPELDTRTPQSFISDDELPAWLKEDISIKEAESSEEIVSIETEEDISEWEKLSSESEPVEIPEWLLEEKPTIAEIRSTDVDASALREPVETFEEIQVEGDVQVGEDAQVEEKDTTPLGDTQPRKVVASDEEVIAPTEEIDMPTDAIPPEIPSEKISPLGDTDAAYAWLESLAVKQGADEALLLRPEERLETPPEWVQQAALEETEFIPPTSLAESIEQEEIEELKPDETEVIATEESISQVKPFKEPISSAEETEFISPAFLAESIMEEGIEEIEPEESEEISAEELIENLKPQEEPVPTMEEEIIPEAETTSLEDIGKITEAEPENSEVPEIFEEVPELPDWLLATESETHEDLEWKPPELIEKININEASLVDFEKLPGIGFVMAQRIIEYRETNGPFDSIEDLVQVYGLGPATLDEIRDQIDVEIPSTITFRLEEETLAIDEEEEISPRIVEARDSLSQGNLEQALEIYGNLIQTKHSLPTIIKDLEEITANQPQDIRIWQNLGDAYLREDKVKEALDAYIKAEKLLH